MNPTDRRLQMDLAAARYLEALERDDFETMAAVWELASADPELAAALREIHAGLIEEQTQQATAAPQAAMTAAGETHLPSADMVRPSAVPVADGTDKQFRQPPDRRTAEAHMLQLKGVVKAYGGSPALHKIDLEIPAGATTVLIGPSGCGKSTLLRLLVGLIQPDEGVVTFGGEPITPASARQLRRRIGFVVQDGGLFPHLTARGNATLMARHLGWKSGPIDERLAKLMELTQFPRDRLDHYPAQLSGGQRQRVSLMRGLMLDPSVFLLDEPLGALDRPIRKGLQTDLRRAFQTLKKTVVLVTHDIKEAEFLGDVIVLMCEGRIVQQGAFADLMEHPADDFVKTFLED